MSEDEQLWDKQLYSHKISEHVEQLLNAEREVSDDKEEIHKEQTVSDEDEVLYEEDGFWDERNDSTKASSFEKHLKNEEDEMNGVPDDERQLKRDLKDSIHEYVSAYDQEVQLEQNEVYKAKKYLHEEQKKADNYYIVDEDKLQNKSGAHKIASDGKQLQEEQHNTHTVSNQHHIQKMTNELSSKVVQVKEKSRQTHTYTETARRRVYKWTIFQSYASRKDAQTNVKYDRKQIEQFCPPCVCP